MAHDTETAPARPVYQHGVFPDARGRYGEFGGRFVPESLMAALDELEAGIHRGPRRSRLRRRAGRARAHVHRPAHAALLRRTPLTPRGRARLTSSAKTSPTPARTKSTTPWARACSPGAWASARIIAETGAGQHGVATATVCAKLGLECVVYMGEEDIHRQSLNVFRMKLLGAEVRPVTSGSRTLKDAINEAMRDWVTNVASTHYLIGSAVGPHPYPRIVRDFQSVIGREARAQVLDTAGRLPDLVVACVGGGSNAIGMFHPFAGDPDVRLVGVEAGGRGIATGRARRHPAGRPARRAPRRAQLPACRTRTAR